MNVPRWTLPGRDRSREPRSGRAAAAALLTTNLEPPPAHLRAAVIAAIGRTEQVSPSDGAVVDLGARRRRSRRPSPAGKEARREPRFNANHLLRAAAVVAVFAAGVLIGTSRADDDPDPAGDIEYAGPMGIGPESIGELSITATGIGRVIQFDTDQLPILPVGEYYEVWFVAPDDTVTGPNRISAGTFHPDPDGSVSVQFAAAVDPSIYPIVEITAEPGDGNPAATGPTVASVTVQP